MKKSRFLEIVKEEIQKQLYENGSESMYFAPSGFDQISRATDLHIQRYTNFTKWQVIALQKGAVVQDRGDDWIALLPNQDKLGTFSKITQTGIISTYN